MSDKRVVTRFPVLSALVERWSPRSFSARPPSRRDLASLFEAARLAPSAHNTQPAHFVLTRAGHGTGHERLVACLGDHNRHWASQAPVLVLATVMTERPTDRRDASGDPVHVAYPHAMHDLGLAVMSLIIQARALDLFAHPMAGFDPEAAHAAFRLPPRYAAGLVVAVGYPGSPDTLPEALRVRELAPRVRRPLEELVSEEMFGEPTDLFGIGEGHE
jgi:nitroreductase